jgi:hypothetical protein
MLSTVAFNFDLRHYNTEELSAGDLVPLLAPPVGAARGKGKGPEVPKAKAKAKAAAVWEEDACVACGVVGRCMLTLSDPR